jgi:hypothetical protein
VILAFIREQVFLVEGNSYEKSSLQNDLFFRVLTLLRVPSPQVSRVNTIDCGCQVVPDVFGRQEMVATNLRGKV